MRSAPEAPYIVWILVSTVGLLQALASHYGLLGLSFFRDRPRLGYVSAAVLIPLSYFWFFSMTNRNVPGLEGWQLFSRFGAGAVAGLAVVLIISSVVNRSRTRQDEAPHAEGGLDALRREPYGVVVRRVWRKIVQDVRTRLDGEESRG